MAVEIDPIWLEAAAQASGEQVHTLPLPWRLRLAIGGCAFILALDAPNAKGEEASAELVFLSTSDTELARTSATGPRCALFLPKGTTRIRSRSASPVRLGLFPRSKVALKLHAFIFGRFSGPSGRRWREAGAAARDLRGFHAALLESSPARHTEQAVRYRRYRATHVGDFQEVVPPARELRLTFLSVLDCDTTRETISKTLEALKVQSDPDWEWLLAATADTPADHSDVVQDLISPCPNVRLVRAEATGNGLLEQAMACIEGGLVAALPLSGRPTRDAVAMIRAAFAAHPACEVVYTDEERLDAQGRPEAGLFKPAFNRHLLRATNYVGDLVALRTDTLRRAPRQWLDGDRHALHLAILDGLPPGAIRHIPRVAFSTPAPCHAAPLATHAAAASRILGVEVSLTGEGHLRAHYTVPEPGPLVSVVVPTRDRADLMGMALRSLIAQTQYKNFEIVIVDNGSVEEKTFALFDEIQRAWPKTQIIRDEGDFNYPRICNAGVAAARGSVLCLLNNDIEVVDGAWLGEMVALSALPRTGIVGAKLLFPDRTIQHAGVIVGLFRYAAHWFSHAPEQATGPFGRLVNRTNVSAVTGACLVITRACWDEIGPLDAERFAEDCNDIDLCLRARHAGYEVVWTPYACLVHHESASRGRRRARAHRNRLKAQRQRMEALWHTSTLVDPHYNPNLSRTSLHAALASTPQGPRDARTDAIPAPDNRL